MALATKNISEAICGSPLRDRARSVSVIGISGISLAMVIFLLRILARAKSHQFGTDDWTMILAMVH